MWAAKFASSGCWFFYPLTDHKTQSRLKLGRARLYIDIRQIILSSLKKESTAVASWVYVSTNGVITKPGHAVHWTSEHTIPPVRGALLLVNQALWMFESSRFFWKWRSDGVEIKNTDDTLDMLSNVERYAAPDFDCPTTEMGEESSKRPVSIVCLPSA